MKKYICSICGYIYDEAVGNSEGGIPLETKWKDVPDSWVCPLCGATKDEFKEEKTTNNSIAPELSFESDNIDQIGELSMGELSVMCSNLSKGCEKQYRPEEADLFNELSEYFKSKSRVVNEEQLSDLTALIQEDLSSGYEKANQIAAKAADRGSLRALTWGEKVTRILSSIINRYEKQQEKLLENTNIYVCEICGFIYIGDEVSEICPVCKVPKMKIIEIKRG